MIFDVFFKAIWVRDGLWHAVMIELVGGEVEGGHVRDWCT
jgi:hypothetical protein